jgi:redox-sensing transcriptional repressor
VGHPLSDAGLRRLPRYAKLLMRLAAEGQRNVTSGDLARVLKLDETLVRKDLSVTGFVGRPRVGFAVEGLLAHLQAFLGLTTPKETFLVGAGRLGQALTNYKGFERFGLTVVGLFDNNPAKIGHPVGTLTIEPLWRAPALARLLNVRIAIITVPPAVAQAVAELLVDAGITAIWNFSGQPLKLPDTVVVENEDLAESLAVFSHRIKRVMGE